MARSKKVGRGGSALSVRRLVRLATTSLRKTYKKRTAATRKESSPCFRAAQYDQLSTHELKRCLTAGASVTISRHMPGNRGLGRRSSRFLVKSEWRSTVMRSMSWRARTHVTSLDLIAPS